MRKLSEIPDVRLDTQGVMYKYLILKLESAGEAKEIVRGLTSTEDEARAVRWVEEELDEAGIGEDARRIEILGGGSLSLNPYSETVTVFGASPKYGEESDRAAVAHLVEKAFEEYTVSWYPADTSSEAKVSASSA
jgi:hypothetical protein